MGDVKMIMAIGTDGSLGRNGDLIWQLPGDLKRFKSLTMGYPVIMGRKTWDSLPKKPLAGRRNIILTRQTDFKPQGAETAKSVEEALKLAGDESPFIIGGAEIYKAFLPLATELYLTEVNDTCPDADARLEINRDNYDLIESGPEEKNPDGVAYRYVTYRKKKG